MGVGRFVGSGLLVAVLCACEGRIGSVSVPGDGPRPSVVEVGADAPTLTVERRCVSTLPDERALGVGPNGSLWLARSSTTALGETAFRTFAAPDAVERRFTLELGRVDAAVVHSATVASVLADGAPWVIRDASRVRVSAPFGPSEGAALCGDLGGDAFVLDRGALHQRDGAEWLAWDGVADATGPGARLMARDGACWVDGDAVRLRGGDGRLWSLDPVALRELGGLSGPAVVRETEVVEAVDDELLVGGVRYRLAFGPVTSLSSGGRHVWAVSGDAVLRLDDAGASIVPQLEGTTRVLGFAAGGAWAVSPARACLVDPGLLAVRGLPPGSRQTDDRLVLRAEATGRSGEITLLRDGATVAPIAAGPGAVLYELTLGVGWSRFELSGDDRGSGRTVRRFQVKRTPEVTRSWETDIRPIYEASCAAAACHVADSPSGAPDLGEFEAWVRRADAIEQRVLVTEDMPPLATRGPEWTEDAAQTIREWLGGGLRP